MKYGAVKNQLDKRKSRSGKRNRQVKSGKRKKYEQEKSCTSANVSGPTNKKTINSKPNRKHVAIDAVTFTPAKAETATDGESSTWDQRRGGRGGDGGAVSEIGWLDRMIWTRREAGQIAGRWHFLVSPMSFREIDDGFLLVGVRRFCVTMGFGDGS